MTPTLRTDRLLLAPYTPVDEEGFVALFGDERVSRWMGDGPEPEAANRALFWRVFDVYAENRFDVWGVRRDGRLIGHGEIKPTDTVNGYEIIYALAFEAWGSGFGIEVARALVAYGFGTLGLSEVHATVNAENEASLALLSKIGFVHVRDIHEDDGVVVKVLTCRAGRDRPLVPPA